MIVVSFTVPGNPMGFIMNRSPWSKRGQAYIAYREKVKLYAKQAGLPVPLMPTKDRPYHISTVAIYSRHAGRGPDPLNVNKCVGDALCYHGKMPGKKKGSHDDFWTSGDYAAPMFGDEPCVMVTVRGMPKDESVA